MKIKVYDLKGKEQEVIEIKLDIEPVSDSLITQYVRIYQTNQRQGNAHTKSKGEVRGGGRKPWKQKGTGRARHGSSRSPLWRGGGVIHGPRSKDWALSLNKKMKKRILQTVLEYKGKENSVIGLAYPAENVFSTKSAADFIKVLKLSDKKTLVVQNSPKSGVYESFRNIPRVNVTSAAELSAYDLLGAHNIVFEKKAVELIQEKVE